MLRDEIKFMYNVAMGSYIEKYAKTHKRFFTQKEFEENYAKITMLTLSKTKLDKIALDLEEEQKRNKQLK